MIIALYMVLAVWLCALVGLGAYLDLKKEDR